MNKTSSRGTYCNSIRYAFLRSAGLGVLVVACIPAQFSSAPAQEGVAGSSPVITKAKKTGNVTEARIDPEAAKKSSDIRVLSNLVVTPVTVLDSKGEFVYDLEEKDFKVFDNGVPQRIENFDMEMRPLAAVIVVQTNGMVAPLLDDVHPLGSMFSGLLLGEQGQAAVVTYDDRINQVQDFSNESDLLKNTLAGLKGRGDKARLNDALSRAVSMLEKRPKAERRVVVAFSDGFDKGSETTEEEIVHRATAAEVSIYGLGFNPAQELLKKKPEGPQPSPLDTNVTRPLPPGTAPTPTNSENVYGAPVPAVDILVATGQIIRSALASSLLEVYAGYTGGVFYSHWSKKALQEQLSRIASEVHSQYELAYVPDTLDKMGFHRIEVQVGRKGVKVRTRAGYFYPASSPEEKGK